jgi:hypothetical protein
LVASKHWTMHNHWATTTSLLLLCSQPSQKEKRWRTLTGQLFVFVVSSFFWTLATRTAGRFGLCPGSSSSSSHCLLPLRRPSTPPPPTAPPRLARVSPWISDKTLASMAAVFSPSPSRQSSAMAMELPRPNLVRPPPPPPGSLNRPSAILTAWPAFLPSKPFSSKAAGVGKKKGVAHRS